MCECIVDEMINHGQLAFSQVRSQRRNASRMSGQTPTDLVWRPRDPSHTAIKFLTFRESNLESKSVFQDSAFRFAEEHGPSLSFIL